MDRDKTLDEARARMSADCKWMEDNLPQEVIECFLQELRERLFK